ncbi:hypothetical protein [Solibacillus sp. NPDC093137]|uniref:hypothetical protein n=1 Tax=Solibacillus sp. NPDC093137 TaxID=3390678 RepID=UPI003CFE891D
MKKSKWAKGITFISSVLLVVLYWNIDSSEKNQTDWLLPIIYKSSLTNSEYRTFDTMAKKL